MVSFDVFPLETKPGWHSVLHLSAFGRDVSRYGDRIPGVWFYPNSNKLYICSAISGNKNYCKTGTDTAIPLLKWSSVVIKQRQAPNGKYLYEIFINAKKVLSVYNTRIQTFKEAKLYIGDPWYKHQLGYIRNLSIDEGT